MPLPAVYSRFVLAAVKMVYTNCICSGVQRAPCALTNHAAQIHWHETSEFVIARPRRGRGNLAVPGWITGRPRRKRNCLPEIAPQGHFLALRAQGATSAFGLLAMTIRGPLPFYRQPVRIVSAAPGAACRSPTTHDWQFCVTFHFPFCIFHLHHASPLRFALHSITKNCRTRVGAAAERISYLLRAR